MNLIKALNYYPHFFSATILVLLFLFVPVSDLTLSAISNDFRWRTDLISLYTSFRFNIGDKVYNQVVIGKDGWFFLTDEVSIRDYQNTNPLSTRKLIRFQTRLDKLKSQLESQGITLVIVIPPNKSTVYSQYMPDELPVLGQESALDQFVHYMEQNSNTAILDLRQTLIKVSKTQDVYHRTDTHWNSVGAYYSYVEVMNILAADYPMLAPHRRSDFDYVYAGNDTRDLARIMGLDSYKEGAWILVPKVNVQLQSTQVDLPDGVHTIRTVINADQSFPKLLVYSDSFYGPLGYFIEPHFSRVKVIPFVSDNEIWSLHWIQQENPNIVIIEFVERSLDLSLPTLLANSTVSP